MLTLMAEEVWGPMLTLSVQSIRRSLIQIGAEFESPRVESVREDGVKSH